MESLDESDEGYDSLKDEISSASSYNPNKGRLDMSLRTSLSLQSFGTKCYVEGRQSQADNSNSFSPPPSLSVLTTMGHANSGRFFILNGNQVLEF